MTVLLEFLSKSVDTIAPTAGPVLRPIKPRGIKALNNTGFEVNLEEFLVELTALLN